MPPSDVPSVVDAAWLMEHLHDDDLVVGDVRGPNAHTRGHIAGSRPLVLGSPPPAADADAVAELAKEVALRLRRHGITGAEQLVLVDRGDGVGAMPAAQMAELAGHPARRDLARRHGCVARRARRRAGRARAGARGVRSSRTPRALPTRQELESRLGDPTLTLLDVRREDEYTGKHGSPCDPRQGHIPGAKRVEVGELFACAGTAARAGGDPRARRCAGRSRGRRVLPLRLALGARDACAAERGLRRAQLRRLLARVEPLSRAAARALGARGDARPGRDQVAGCVQKRAAERTPELVPAVDLLERLRAQAVGIGRRVRRVDDPALELRRRDLGMELDAPARIAETERLRARGAARQLDGARRQAVGVVVPLRAPRTRPVARRARGLRRRRLSARRRASRSPARPASADTRAPAARASSCTPRQTPSTGVWRASSCSQPERLVAEPRVMVILVGVHRTAEHEYRVVRIERARRRRAPAERPLVEPVPDSSTAGAKSSARASVPWITERTCTTGTLRSRRWPGSGSCRAAAAAAARSSRPARSGRADSADPPPSSCC